MNMHKNAKQGLLESQWPTGFEGFFVSIMGYFAVGSFVMLGGVTFQVTIFLEPAQQPAAPPLTAPAAAPTVVPTAYASGKQSDSTGPSKDLKRGIEGLIPGQATRPVPPPMAAPIGMERPKVKRAGTTSDLSKEFSALCAGLLQGRPAA